MTVLNADIITQRIDQIRQSMPESVRLIAVTKQVAPAAMRIAYAAGIRDFGESRIQEAEWKQAELQDLADVTWHLLGHLQTNKAAKALQLFQWIHSVDRLKIADRLNQLAASLAAKPQICLQVKLLPDPNKGGWEVPALHQDLPLLDAYENLRIRGLMAIPPLGLTEQELATFFQAANTLKREIQTQAWQRICLTELSMGMSGDYAIAIESGATMIRLGRILFGERTA